MASKVDACIFERDGDSGDLPTQQHFYGGFEVVKIPDPPSTIILDGERRWT